MSFPSSSPESGNKAKQHGLGLQQWNCTACSFLNKASSKTCEMCSTERPAKLPLSLRVTVPSHPTYRDTPLALEEKHALSLGFLKDLLEAKCAVPDRKQMLLWKELLIEGKPGDRFVDLLPHDCNTADVIVLTLHHADHLSAADETKPPPGGAPLLRKKSSRSKAGERPHPSPSPQPARAAAADGFGDDDEAFADDADGDAGWGDDDGAGWDGSDADGFEEEPRSSVAPASSAAAAASAAAASFSAAAAPASKGFVSALSHDGDDDSTFESCYARTASYILRKPSQLEAHVRALLAELGELLGLSPDEAAILCRNFRERWNRARIEDAWMEDSDKLREEVGLGPETHSTAAAAATEGKLVECETCGDDEVPAAQSYALSCGHVFCLSCWQAWILAEFDKGPVCVTTRCQGFKCRVVVPLSFQLKCLPLVKREKLMAWMLEDFVSAHPRGYKGCPHSDCVMTAQRVEGVEHVGGVDCACAHSWCFDCGLEDHRPASCEDAKRWNDKNNSEAENTNWILANTKVCPKCQVHIEKNQGCNHMTCRKCSHQFCWLCKADWAKHSSCAAYSGDSAQKKEEAAAATAQNELKKYMFYWSRFDNHAKSIKFAEKTRKAAEERMSQLQSLKGTNLLEVQFLVDASNCVISNKRILQWLYVYAYYFPAPEGSSDRALVEMQQAQLEKFTDELHGMTEQSMEELMKPESRVRILSFTATVAKYRRAVMEAVEASEQQRREQRRQGEEDSKPQKKTAQQEPSAAAAADAKKGAAKKKAKA